MPQTSPNSQSKFYVYVLHKSEGAATSFDDIFYVGKGIDFRFAEHFKQNESDSLTQTSGRRPTSGKLTSNKADIISDIIKHSPQAMDRDTIAKRHTQMVATDLTEDEAFRIESILISMYADVTGTELGNDLHGHHHHDVWQPAEEALSSIAQFDYPVARPENLVTCGDAVLLLVNGKQPLKDFEYSIVPGFCGRVDGSLRAERGSEIDEREEWDPWHPPSVDSSRHHADRFWKISPENVREFMRLAGKGRLRLGLLAPTSRGGGVVRHLWRVTDAPWIDVWYDGHPWRWVIPLDPERITDDPWYGAKPQVNGKGVMACHNSGITWVLDRPPTANDR